MDTLRFLYHDEATRNALLKDPKNKGFEVPDASKV